MAADNDKIWCEHTFSLRHLLPKRAILLFLYDTRAFVRENDFEESCHVGCGVRVHDNIRDITRVRFTVLMHSLGFQVRIQHPYDSWAVLPHKSKITRRLMLWCLGPTEEREMS